MRYAFEWQRRARNTSPSRRNERHHPHDAATGRALCGDRHKNTPAFHPPDQYHIDILTAHFVRHPIGSTLSSLELVRTTLSTSGRRWSSDRHRASATSTPSGIPSMSKPVQSLGAGHSPDAASPPDRPDWSGADDARLSARVRAQRSSRDHRGLAKAHRTRSRGNADQGSRRRVGAHIR